MAADLKRHICAEYSTFAWIQEDFYGERDSAVSLPRTFVPRLLDEERRE